jgi:hypothetical protein
MGNQYTCLDACYLEIYKSYTNSQLSENQIFVNGSPCISEQAVRNG